MSEYLQTNLTLDWDGSPEAYTCYTSKRDYWPNPSINPISSCVHIPKNYWVCITNNSYNTSTQ